MGEGRDGGGRRVSGPPTSVLPHEGGGRSVELRERLLSLHGIGPETADSILLYAMHHPVFVVDAYTRRIGQRMGFLKTNDYNQIQDYFQSALHPSPPPSPLSEGRGRAHRRAGEGEGSRHFVKLYNEFHALLVRHAKETCTKRDPACPACPVQVDCAYARRRQ
jgi:endonuclease III related protein